MQRRRLWTGRFWPNGWPIIDRTRWSWTHLCQGHCKLPLTRENAPVPAVYGGGECYVCMGLNDERQLYVDMRKQRNERIYAQVMAHELNSARPRRKRRGAEWREQRRAWAEANKLEAVRRRLKKLDERRKATE